MRGLLLTVALGACTFGDNIVEPDPVSQCLAIFDAFCTEASTCQHTPRPTTDEDVAACRAAGDSACGYNRSLVSPLAFQVCLLSIEESGCDEQGFRASPGAKACLAFVDSWAATEGK